ncbi:MAG: TonB-dependent receptor [Opitutaceae bacterium]|nr:TonB-dependent receptor [Opitutaceae bacterium]
MYLPLAAAVLALPALAVSLAAQSAALVAASDNVSSLPSLIVSASRTPQDPKNTPSSVSQLPVLDLQAEQTPDLRSALGWAPGVAVVASGGLGGQTAIFLRGANSDQTLFLVDGVRLNSRSDNYLNFLGGADLAGFDRIEVLRGPQSTLYGSSAIGGVILLETAHGCGAPTGVVEATAGSFDSYGATAAVKGGDTRLGYSLSLMHLQTANDRPDNDYREWGYSSRIESLVTPALLIGATFRGQQGDYQEPGSRFFLTDADVKTHNHLLTVYTQWNDGSDFSSRLTAALHRQDYEYADSYSTSRLRNIRDILDWQNTWTVSPRAEVVAGANAEWSRYTVDGVPSEDDSHAGYLSASWHPAPPVILTGGLRYDDFKSAGDATTWRSGVSWRPRSETKLHASYGTGFNAPGSADRFGVAEWGQLPNPNLRPEKSQGWDAGIDQSLAGDRVSIGATYFHNQFRDLFEYQIVDYTTFQGYTVNRAHASAEGVEFSASVRPIASVIFRGVYTYLDARNDDSGARLIRRPRHVGDADVHVQVTKAWMLGGGVHLAAGRIDSAGSMPSYTTVRLYTSYEVGHDWSLKLRMENLFDRTYEDVLGYPAPSSAIYGSVARRF